MTKAGKDNVVNAVDLAWAGICILIYVKTSIAWWVMVISAVVLFSITGLIIPKILYTEADWEEEKAGNKRKKKSGKKTGSSSTDQFLEVLALFDESDLEIEDILLDVLAMLRNNEGRLAYDTFDEKKVLFICFMALAPTSAETYPDDLRRSAIWTIRYFRDRPIAVKVLSAVGPALEDNPHLHSQATEALMECVARTDI